MLIGNLSKNISEKDLYLLSGPLRTAFLKSNYCIKILLFKAVTAPEHVWMELIKLNE